MDTTTKLIEQYLGQMDAKPKTKRTYKNALDQFDKWMTANGNPDINKDTILRYKDYLMNAKISDNKDAPNKYTSSTINAYLSSVMGLTAWMTDEGMITKIKGIKGVKTSRYHKKDALTIDQAKALLRVYDDANTPPGSSPETYEDAQPLKHDKNKLTLLRDKSITMTLLYTGTRAVELSRALVKDIHQIGNQTVLNIQGKGKDGKDDFVVLVPSVQKVISEYLFLRKAQPNEPLFMSESHNNQGGTLKTNAISKIIKDGLKKIGVNDPRKTCHSTRHFYATALYLQGVDILTISKALRHSNIQTTTIYIDEVNKLQAKAEKSISMILDDDAPILGTSDKIMTIQGA